MSHRHLRFLPRELSKGCWVGLAAFCVLLATSCTATSLVPPAPVTLRISGSTSMTPALEELAQAYAASHPNVLVEVRGGGTAIGLEELQDGAVDLAAVSGRLPTRRSRPARTRSRSRATPSPSWSTRTTRPPA